MVELGGKMRRSEKCITLRTLSCIHAAFPFSETYALPWQVSVVIGRLYIHNYIVEDNVPYSRLYIRIYETVICSATPDYIIQAIGNLEISVDRLARCHNPNR